MPTNSTALHGTNSITAIVLTFNEEQHIERCIRSLEGVVERVCVIDSFSTDRTKEIAEQLGAEVTQNPWKNYATQFQFGLNNCDITSTWTMRIDADEYLEESLRDEIRLRLSKPHTKANAIYLRRKMIFLGRPITHGFFYPAMMLRIWKTGAGRIEQRWMDEHVIVESAQSLILEQGDLVDHNLNDLSWWINKHNGYATREVYDMVEIMERGRNTRDTGMENMTGQAARKRWLKEKIYSRLPPTWRASFYFFYRYILGRGFLDGKEGFFFHFLQAYWYRTLVEAKLFELEKRAKYAQMTPYDLLKKEGVL